MNDLKKLQAVLDHYDFTDAVPADFRKSALKQRKKLLKNILKEVDEYSLFFGLTISLILFLSRWGLKVSLTTAKFLMVGLICTGISLPVTYTAVTVRQYYQNLHELPGDPKQAALPKGEDISRGEKANTPDQKPAVLLPETRTIAFRELKFIGGDSKLAREFSGLVKRELAALLKERKRLAMAGGTMSADFTLLGNVRQKEAGYFVALRLVKVSSGEILTGEYFTAPTSEDFSELCRQALEKLLAVIPDREERK